MELLENKLCTGLVDLTDKRFEGLYEKAFLAFAKFASNRKTSYEDAKDIFHDAMVIYLEKSSDPGFRIHSSPEAYVVGISKHLWSRKFRRDRQQVSLDEELAISIPADFFPSQKELSLLNFLERTGEKCMDLLQRFYFEKASLRDIATFLGYRTEHSAAVQKFKCIRKLRDVVKAKAIKYEDFPH
jgi:DNA-directed RNA polymerase specialized sigma24 family protein